MNHMLRKLFAHAGLMEGDPDGNAGGGSVLTDAAIAPATAATDDAAAAADTRTDEEKAADAAKEAAGAPEKYEDFKLPEGVELDTAMLEQAIPIFKELNLTQEQAQKLVDFESARVAQARQAQADQFNTLINSWVEQAKADKEFGGDHFDESVKTARIAVDKFGTPEFKQLMEDHGVGNHPEMIRFMLRVGKTLREDSPGSNGNKVAGKQDRVSILYPPKEA